LDGVLRALSELGGVPEAVVWADEMAEVTRERLLACSGVLVWVNPITNGRDRTVLDGVLREVAKAGVWVSAHPDVIDTIGTKEVLYRTRVLVGRRRPNLSQRRDRSTALNPGPADPRPIVLEAPSGHDGLGVWKISLIASEREPSLASIVSVTHAYDGVTSVFRSARSSTDSLTI
jgi:hypothetical protein